MTLRSLFVAMPLALVVSACTSDGDQARNGDSSTSWGPLAVVEGAGSTSQALTSGRLVVGDRCVTLRWEGGEQLLVWPSQGTTWNPESRTITYSDGDDSAELSDGDHVSFGGGEVSSTESRPVDPTVFVASIDHWLSQPNPSCVTGEFWFIGGLVPNRDGVGGIGSDENPTSGGSEVAG